MTAGDKVAAIEIDQGGKILKVAEKNGKWVVASQEDYPANVEAVRGLVLAASGLGDPSSVAADPFS